MHKNFNIVVSAPTGSGKTLAFILPLLQEDASISASTLSPSTNSPTTY